MTPAQMSAERLGDDVMFSDFPGESATPYATAGRPLKRAGFNPLPVPPRQKDPVPVGYTGYRGKTVTQADVKRWEVTNATSNVAIRLPGDVIGIDVDNYDLKHGATDLEDLEKQHGTLPPTWSSTSRPGTGSGIRLLRVPPGTRFPPALSSSIEIIQAHHRYVIVNPSVHPEGRVYHWYDTGGERAETPPAIDDLADLPWAWIEALSLKGPAGSASDPASTEEVDAFIDANTERLRPGALKGIETSLANYKEPPAPGKLPKGRHDTLVDRSCQVARESAAGWYTAAEGFALLQRWWKREMDNQRRIDGTEFADALAWGIGQANAEPERIMLMRAEAKARQADPFTTPPADVDAVTGEITRPVTPCELAECLAVYRKWLHLPDDDQVIAALGAAAANLLPGDPLWILFVGVPGSGKTETIHPLAVLPYVHSAATITEAALLSGTPAKEKAKGARGGLLRELGEFGIILVKDFSGVLSMNRDARAAVLSALREVYDGSWTRRIGADGGRSLEWIGKAGLVGAVTPSIDRHHAVMGALGERFVLYRLEVTDPKAQARRRLGNRGRERAMRLELADAVAGVLAGIDRDTPPRALDDHEADRLVDLSTFVVRARTAVERDGYDREVVVMPSAEAPGRLIGALGAFLSGLEVIGADTTTAWRIVTKAGWDCVPDMRRRLLFALRQHPQLRTAELVSATGIPKTTTDRTLEDMALLGLIDRTKGGSHDNSTWVHSLSEQTNEEWP